MTHKERFVATIERKRVDRPACWLGLPAPEALDGLKAYFGAADIEELKRRIDDDIFPVDVPYHCPPANHIACAFDFSKKNDGIYEERTLTSPGFFEDYTDPARVDDFKWPDPARHMSAAECLKAIDRAPADCAVLGMMWSAHFQDVCAAFGMETAMVKMLTDPEMVSAVADRIVRFYLAANRMFYEAGRGKLDAVLIGNDLGSQNGLMLSPELIRKFVWPGTKKLVAQAKSYGLKVIHHSCGAVDAIIPDLIELGVDAIHPIQALAQGMEPEGLKKRFGGKMSFCGGVDVQQLLVKGPPEMVRDKVEYLKKIFPTGLIISPSHEAILPDVDPRNIAALFNAVK